MFYISPQSNKCNYVKTSKIEKWNAWRKKYKKNNLCKRLEQLKRKSKGTQYTEPQSTYGETPQTHLHILCYPYPLLTEHTAQEHQGRSLTNILQRMNLRLTSWQIGESQACCKRAENALPMVARPDAHFSLDSFCSSSSGMKFSQDWAITANAEKPCSTTYHDYSVSSSIVPYLTHHQLYHSQTPFFNRISPG